MKHLKLFFALFAMLALGVGNAWAADEYELVTSSAELEADCHYVLGATYSGTTYFVSNVSNNNNRKLTTATVTNSKVAATQDMMTFTLGGSDGAWTFKTDNYLGTAGYLNATSTTNNNYLKVVASDDNYNKFTISITNEGVATITCNGKSSRHIMYLNGSTTFSCYSSKTEAQYIKPRLYKKITEVGGAETTVSTPTFSTAETTFYTSSFDVELDCATEGATIHYTLNGEDPTTSSTVYSDVLTISATTTIKAIAVKDGLINSEIATATYTKGEPVNSYVIDFEKNALEAYVNWDFNNIAVATTKITAKAGTYYGNTCGKASASIKTKTAIQYPGTLTFHTSKETDNTTSSNWIVQVSENGSTWTEVTSFDATTGSKGTWTERTADLSDYENVYVQISYSGSTAIRAIDEISLAQGVAPVKYTLTIESPENGTLLVTNGGASVASGDQFKAGTSLVVTPTPASGYLFESLTVDGSEVELSEGKYTFTMPENDVTISATFKANEKPAATLTLSKNGETELLPGNHKQDDVVTLPDFESDCSKTFVGWSENQNCNTEPEYKAGDSYQLKLEGNQTLYAVYADGESGEASLTKMTSSDALADGDKIVIVANGTKLGMYQETISTSYVNNWELGAEEPTISELDEKKIWDVVAVDGSWKLGDATNGYLYHSSSNNLAVSTAEASTWTIAWKTTGFTFKSDQNRYLACRTDLTTDKKNLYRMNGTSVSSTNGSVYEMDIYKYSVSAPTYSNYSTTCAAAPKAEVTPTEVTATAAGVEGKVTVTYENVNTENVAVALFNDEACTEAFTADWLTASLDGDKNITYTVAATTLYTERKAYIQLTAPDAAAATDPAVVVIPVTQAAKDKVFASLEALLAAITPTAEGVEVTVTLNNEVIQDFYTSGSYRNGIALNVPYQGGVKVIEIYCKDVPAEWVKGGKVSGTITCPWKLYNSTWELCPTAWTELTYTAPATVKSIAVSGTPTKTTYVDGEAFDPTGLVVTATLTDDSTEPIDVALVDWTFNPETLSKGETSVSVVATYNTMASAAYEVTGLTVNDIPTKTVAEFIAAGGTRCYLEGIVSNITNTTYGNFDLTDASGTIYVYGCLNATGEEQKFTELGVKNGDKIKVIAEDYELFGGTKEEAKNVQYVSHISAASITVENITMEVDEVATISATVDPIDAVVTYTIKENAANAISLNGNTITALAEGTATITATVAEGETYLGNSVDFTVTVGPKTESDEVVILAELDGKWYAMKGAVPTGQSNQLDALEVTYFNGILYNVEEADKASITWTRTIVDGKATSFVNNGKYLKGGSSANLTLVASVDNNCKWMWDEEKGYYTTNTSGTIRTFLYRENYNFKNYAASEAGKNNVDGDYANISVVTAPVYAAGDIVYTREGLTNGKFGTICLPYGSTEYSGATFFKIAYRETGKVYIDEVTTLEAGVPYIFQAKSATLTVTCEGEAVGDAGSANGLYGTFIEIADVAAHTSNKGYILTNNLIRFCEANCNVPANRAYIVLDEISTEKTPAPVNRRRVGMSVQGENETTGVEDLFTTESPAKVIENGQLIIIRNGVKYNVQGVRL